MNNGATLDLVAVIPKAISTAEREAIETAFQINGAQISADESIKPTGVYDQHLYYLSGYKYLKSN